MTRDVSTLSAQLTRLRNELHQLQRARRLPIHGQAPTAPKATSEEVEHDAPSNTRWVWTAVSALAILVMIFGGYELIERTALTDADPGLIYALHIIRGMGSAVVLGTWTFFVATRMRRHYARRLTENIERLEEEVQARTFELERSHAFTEHLFDTLHDRIVVTDARGNVVKVNRVARESGPCPCESPCGEAECDQGCRLGAGGPERVFRDTRNGRIFEVDRYPVPARDGDPALVLEFARDVTEAKRLEALVVHHEKMASLGVLAAGIAHDIGNPLASLSSELELLASEEDPGAMRDSLGVLNTHVERINRALREIVDFARRRGDDEPGRVDVAVAIDDACRLVRHDKRMRNVKLETTVDQDVPPVRIVEDHLVMVLVNLTLNALDAMPDGGSLTIRAHQVGGEVRIVVTDTGYGMSEEVLGQVFDPLFSTKGEAGTGLGMPVSLSVIRAAGGRMEVRSSVGVGTDVTLSLVPGDTDA